MENTYYIYVLANDAETIYIGVTNNLQRRLYEHQHELVEGFTKRYKLKKLIYFEQTNDVKSALAREKQLKKWNRAKKFNLIYQMNPALEDLSPQLFS